MTTKNLRQRPRPPAQRATKTAAVTLTIDPALKRRWARAIAVVEDAKRRGMSAFDEQWEAVADIVSHDPPLYLAAGCATLRAFLLEYIGEDERTAKRYMRVARFASPHEEELYGITKVDAALSFLEAKTGGALKGRLPIAFDKLKIPVTEGAPKTVAFEDATTEQIAAATRALRGTGRAKESPVAKAVRAALAEDGLRAITVHFAGGKLSLGNVDPAVLPRLGKALARAKTP